MSGRPWWNISGHGTPGRLMRHYRENDPSCEACRASVRARNAANTRRYRARKQAAADIDNRLRNLIASLAQAAKEAGWY